MADALVSKTEQRKVDELVPYAQNPRQMTAKQVADLQASLERFGLVEIPVIDTDNTIVAGHQRLRIMKLLGKGGEVIDVRVPSRKLTDDELKEYNIRSNADHGEWDFDLLANFEKDTLGNWGMNLNELKLNLDKIEEKKEKQKEVTTCPKCGYSW